MTETSRFGGKIKFIMPDNWTQEQTEKLADNVLEQVAPKITKPVTLEELTILYSGKAKPKKKKRKNVIQ
jgi:hypothetical protein